MNRPAHPARPGREAEGEWMRHALDLAAAAGERGEIPVGALVLDPAGEVVGEGGNTRQGEADPTGHAEMTALRQAARSLRTSRLDGCTLVVTMEPCPMCAGASVLARVGRIVLGAWDPKTGACGSVWDVVRDRRSPHRVEVVGGVLEEECSRLVVDFFARRR